MGPSAKIMPHQPNLFSPEPGSFDSGQTTRDPGALDSASLDPGRLDQARLAGATDSSRGVAGKESFPWLERIELLVRVIVRLYLGLLIIVLPWMRFWTENGLFTYSRGTALLAASGFVRGVVSGLGVLNVALACHEMFSDTRKQ
jgi:hypothetical protein